MDISTLLSYRLAMPLNVVGPEAIPLFVAEKMAGRTAEQFAKDLGVPKQRIHELLTGKRQPSKSLQKKLGLRIVYEILPEKAHVAKAREWSSKPKK
jgi:hypothetical protein